jgi:serine/threonine protein kinase
MSRSFDTHALRQAGFSLQPLPSAEEGSWWQGTHRGSNRGVIVRVAPAAPFAEAVVEAAGLIDLMDSGPVGIASPLAVVVCCRDGRLAAAMAAPAAGFSVAADPAVAATLAEDEPVDVCVVYDAAGAAALDAAAVAPTADLVAASARPTARVTETTPATDDASLAETQTVALEPRSADAARPPAQVFAPKTAPLIPADNSSVGSSTATGRLASGPYRSGDVILPGYRLVCQLGKGGFGEVWKATAPGGMGVAIKVISNLGRREGAREYRALRTVKDIRHAHIVPMFGVWLKTSDGRLLDEEEAAKVGGRMLNTDPGQRVTVDPQTVSPLEHLELVIAMGLGDQTLFDRLRVEPEGLEIGRLLGWMRQAALAIDHFNRGADGIERTHAAVQHCDIKPQNILLVGNVVQVCDFGLARVQGEVRATANNLLSIAYAAPEMTQRPYDPSPATDQYSIAVTYYELRTGRLPYVGPGGGAARGELSAFELLRAKAEGRLDLNMVSRGEEQVLRRAMSTDPADRFGSCEEFIDALDDAVKRAKDGEPGAGQSAATPFPWLKAGMFGAGTLVALGLAAALFLPDLWPWKVPPPPPLKELPPDFLAKARAAFEAAVGGESLIDPARMQEAKEWAEKARQGNDDAAAVRFLAELDAVEKIAGLVRAAETDEARLDEATEAARTLPANVPPQLGSAIETAIRVQRKRRATAAVDGVREALLAAVSADGKVDTPRLEDAANQAERARAVAGDAMTKPLLDAIAAVRAVAPVAAATVAEPPGLDEAVSTLDRATTTLPDEVRQRLGHRLADRLVARARQRLKDYEPKAGTTPPDVMRRAIDDSAADAAAAARIDPASWQARREQGRYAAFLGQYEGAVKHDSAALDLAGTANASDADLQDIRSRRAFALLKENRFADAAEDYVVFRADDPKLRLNLWDLHLSAIDGGKIDDAIRILAWLEPRMRNAQAALPQLALWEVLAQEAWLLACGPRADEEAGRRAVALATEALGIEGSNKAVVLDALAAGHARVGQWEDAVERIQQAIEETSEVGEKKALERRADAYRRRQPWSQVGDEPTAAPAGN